MVNHGIHPISRHRDEPAFERNKKATGSERKLLWHEWQAFISRIAKKCQNTAQKVDTNRHRLHLDWRVWWPAQFVIGARSRCFVIEGLGGDDEQLGGVGSPRPDHHNGAGLANLQELRDFTAGCPGVRMTSPCHLAHVLRVTMARYRQVRICDDFSARRVPVMSTDAKPATSSSTPVSSLPPRGQGIRIFMWPKVIFLYPTAIVALLCSIGMATR
jgi:hypothetical protein